MGEAIPRVLIVAGSDSSGGAGIQADIKTVTMLGGYAATAVAAVTVQDTTGVSAVFPVPADIVAAQVRAVLGDIGADAVKTGMLADAATVAAVADALAGCAAPLVVDPVMVAKGGAELVGAEAVAAMIERLLPLAAVVTPNIPELEVLSGRRIARERDAVAAGRSLVMRGVARAVLVKGGHLEGGALDGHEVADWLVTDGAEHRFTSVRQVTRHTHGTGCTLASALATGLGRGLGLVEATAQARDYVQAAIRAAPGFGAGHGPLGHNFALADAGL